MIRMDALFQMHESRWRIFICQSRGGIEAVTMICKRERGWCMLGSRVILTYLCAFFIKICWYSLFSVWLISKGSWETALYPRYLQKWHGGGYTARIGYSEYIASILFTNG